MCEVSGKLIAWVDHELDNDEMADVQRHVQECFECRTQLDAYQEVSRTFDAYLDATVASKWQRQVPLPVRVLGVAGAVALAAVLLVLHHTRVEPPAPRASVKTALSAVVLEAAPGPAPARRVHRPHSVAPVQNQIATNWPPTQPAIQIAIPAESMFPPGAMPEGINFTADLSIAADGSAQQIRLQPRLIGFERRATQP
jgi:hypothetical protein